MQACHVCNGGNVAGSLLCEHCGAALHDTADHPPWRLDPSPAEDLDYKQITVMFCDLARSTDMASRVPAWTYRSAIVEFQELCRRVIEAFDGYVAQFLGDGALVFFGYPETHDDDVLRAILAGRELIDRWRAIRQAHTTEPDGLALRIACHCGRVVIQRLPGSTLERSQPAHGLPVVVAARLQQEAPPDAVVITGDCLRLCRGAVTCEALGPRRLRGIEEPVEVFRVIRTSHAANRFDLLRRELRPLVGRTAELGLLFDLWTYARDVQSQCVMISGKPGIGKSRLLAALHERLAGEAGVWRDIACSSLTRTHAFKPLADGVRQLILEHFGSRSALHPDLLRALLASLDIAGRDEVAALYAMLVPGLDAESSQGDPLALKRRIFEVCRRLFVGTATRPLVLAVEDVHWADASTLEFLKTLVETAPKQGLLLIVTFRSGEFEPPWRSTETVHQLALRELPPDQAAALVDQIDRESRLTERQRSVIRARAGGSPLFLEECVLAALERVDRPAKAPVQDQGSSIPVTLHDHINARLDQLGAAKAVAQIASVIGTSFPAGLLRAVCARLESGDDTAPAAVPEALDVMEDAGLVFREQGEEASYTFKHALVRDAAYERLAPGYARLAHGAVAACLTLPGASGPDPEIVAHHLSRGGQPRAALRYWLEAGERAARRSANIEALEHYGAALADAGLLPGEAERRRAEFQIRSARNVPLIALGGWASLQLADNLQRLDSLAAVTAPSRQERLKLARTLFNLRLLQGNVEAARACVATLRTLARDSTDPVERLGVERTAGVCAMLMDGDFVEAERIFNEVLAGLDLDPSRPPAFFYGGEARVAILSVIAWNDWFRGRDADALARIDAARRLAADLDHGFSIAFAACLGGSIRQGMGDVDAAATLAAEALAIAERHGFAYWEAYARLLLGWAEAERGDDVAGIERMRAAAEDYAATGARMLLPYAWTLLGEALLRAGRGADAGRPLDDALREPAAYFRVETLRVLSQRQRQEPDGEARARTTLAEARALAARQGAVALQKKLPKASPE